MSNALVSLEKPEGRDTKSGRFMAGNKLSPGRKIGSKPRLSEKIIQSLTKQWQKHGDRYWDKLEKEDFALFMKLSVHAGVTKHVEISAHVDVAMRADIATFAASYTELQSIIGADIEDAQVIDHDPDIALTGPIEHA
jgi:hypothetical protein